MIEDLLIHRCAIKRPTHAIAAQSKQTGSTTVAVNVACRLQPSGEAVAQSLAGMSVSSSYLGWFTRTTDIKRQDIVLWTDRTPPLELTVEGVERLPALDPTKEHHVEAMLRLRVA